MRMRSTTFRAEHVLTADLVPADVDAVLFWTIWDAGKACSEIQGYERLVYWVAQTTLRDVMGAVNIAQLSTRRKQIDKEIADILEKKTNEWGITVVSVEIRDITIPDDLQESLSAEARAEREYNARIILAEVEKEISEMLVDAATTYKTLRSALLQGSLGNMAFLSDACWRIIAAGHATQSLLAERCVVRRRLEGRLLFIASKVRTARVLSARLHKGLRAFRVRISRQITLLTMLGALETSR